MDYKSTLEKFIERERQNLPDVIEANIDVIELLERIVNQEDGLIEWATETLELYKQPKIDKQQFRVGEIVEGYTAWYGGGFRVFNDGQVVIFEDEDNQYRMYNFEGSYTGGIPKHFIKELYRLEA